MEFTKKMLRDGISTDIIKGQLLKRGWSTNDADAVIRLASIEVTSSLFCWKCGKGNQSASEYCEHCGASLKSLKDEKEVREVQVIKEVEIVKEHPREDTAEDKVRCPKCGSTQVQFVNETQVKGYSTSEGCCGLILLGPLGLLCGLCGTGGKSQVKRMCLKCGNKF